MRRWLVVLTGITGLFSSAPATAFWAYGHETIAAIAYRNVAPGTRAAVDRLLARSPVMDTPQCPARTLAQASMWAECLKSLGPRYSYVTAWHYQNVALCSPFDPQAACADGNCVSAQIERNDTILRDRRLPERARLEALLLLIHLVADIHQPLHAADNGDLGGVRLKAAYGAYAPQNLSLHFIWDGPLAERAISTPPTLVRHYSPVERHADGGGAVADWSRESWQLAHLAYGAVLGGDGCGPTPAPAPTLTNDRIETLVPLVRQQIVRAGLRLARLLDEALD